MDTFDEHLGTEGGPKQPKNMPKKNLKREKTKKNEPNLQTSYVLWLVGKVIHQIRGQGPYGDLGPPYGHRGGLKIAKKGTKKHTKGENFESDPPIIIVLGHILLVFGHFEPLQALFEPP